MSHNNIGLSKVLNTILKDTLKKIWETEPFNTNLK